MLSEHGHIAAVMLEMVYNNAIIYIYILETVYNNNVLVKPFEKVFSVSADGFGHGHGQGLCGCDEFVCLREHVVLTGLQ